MTEAWIQGFQDAYNFRQFNPAGYLLAEYRAGYLEGRRRIR